MNKCFSLVFLLSFALFAQEKSDQVVDKKVLGLVSMAKLSEKDCDKQSDELETFRVDVKDCPDEELDSNVTRKKCCCPCCVNQSCSNFTVNGSLTASGSIKTSSATAGFIVGSVKIISGSGAPTASAPQGSLYLRTDGSGTNDRAYINTNGSTTWTAITTAA